MKKRIASIFTVLTMLLMLVPAGVFAEGEDIAIDANNFPDDNFRRFVQQYDTDSDGFLSQAERESVIEMNVDNREISDLTGIEHFSRLQTLNCSVNQLTELDVSKCERLFSLDCSGNQLTTLTFPSSSPAVWKRCCWTGKCPTGFLRCCISWKNLTGRFSGCGFLGNAVSGR